MALEIPNLDSSGNLIKWLIFMGLAYGGWKIIQHIIRKNFDEKSDFFEEEDEDQEKDLSCDNFEFYSEEDFGQDYQEVEGFNQAPRKKHYEKFVRCVNCDTQDMFMVPKGKTLNNFLKGKKCAKCDCLLMKKKDPFTGKEEEESESGLGALFG